jgi:putative SOS response-associated peptidase YedK
MPVLLSPDQSNLWLRSADLSLLIPAPEDFLLKLPVESEPQKEFLF